MGEPLDAIPERPVQVTTVGLPLAVWGTGYSEFLPRWWEGVQSLTRQPDEISITYDQSNEAAVLSSIPEGYSPKLLLSQDFSTYAQYWNSAINGLTTDWFSICNVDDKFFPQALDEIDAAEASGCNLITDRIKDLEGGRIYKSKWNGRQVGVAWTMVGAEPMRLSLFHAAGGFPEGFRFIDWALAMKMYLVGVKAYDSNIIRIIYDRGLSRATVSSSLHPVEVLNADYAKLREFSKTLGY